MSVMPSHTTPTKLVPPIYLVLHVVAMVAVHRVLPAPRLLPSTRMLGWPLMVLGVAMIVVCAGLFRRRGTTIKPFHESTALVTDGPFRYTRNPIYLSMVVVLAGTAVALGSLLPWLLVPSFVAIIQSRFIRREEAMLGDRFGDDYVAYRRRVRRWL